MSCSPFYETLHEVACAESGGKYVLRFAHDGRSTHVGPLSEYSARGELARLGFAGADIDRWIEGALGECSGACATAAAG